jgi:hypothetical protein
VLPRSRSAKTDLGLGETALQLCNSLALDVRELRPATGEALESGEVSASE